MQIQSRKPRARPLSEINIVPYVDVMLVLLVIFMITAPLLNQGVDVSLPQASAKTLANQSKQPIIVSVDARGALYLNSATHPDRPMLPQALLTRVRAELYLARQEGRVPPVLVRGDRHVSYDHVIQAMTLLQKAGASHVGLLTHLPGSNQKSGDEA